MMLEKDFKEIINNIKEEIINTQIQTMQEVNGNLIRLYFKLRTEKRWIFGNSKFSSVETFSIK